MDFDQVKAWARVEVCRIAESCEGGEATSRAEILDELSQELATCLDTFVSWPFGKVGKVIDQLDDPLWLAFARFILRPIVNELFPEDDPVWIEAGASV